MTLNTFSRRKMSMSFEEVLDGVSKDMKRSVFLADPETLEVTHASPMCLDQFRKMGFTEASGIIGLHVWDLYGGCANFLFDDEKMVTGFALQQQQAWDIIKTKSRYVTSHLIGWDNGGRRIAILFRRIRTQWGETLAYVVEIQLVEELTAENYQKEVEKGNALLPAPLRLVA